MSRAAKSSTTKKSTAKPPRSRAMQTRSGSHMAALAAADGLPATLRRGLPKSIVPELATLVAAPPVGSEWLHEIKLDGYRLICRLDRQGARLLTRRQLDWTRRFPQLAGAVESLGLETAIFDGEVVVLDPAGVSSFQDLQTALSNGATKRFVYYLFDLLYLEGYDLRERPLIERKELLAQVLAGQGPASPLRHSEHLLGNGPEFFHQCCRRGLEGIVSKRIDRPYREGRGRDWLKTKCVQREEFVIGGFTEPASSRLGLGAILVGYFDRPGHLLYAGRVGTGFSASMLVSLRNKLKRLARQDSPFANLTLREAGRGVHWVDPRLVCQVEFTNWTRAHVLRHPSFQGLREDLPAKAVVRDAPVPRGLAEDAPSPRTRLQGASLPHRRATRSINAVDVENPAAAPRTAAARRAKSR